MDKVNIAEKLSLFNDYCNPRIIGELNGQQVKAVKLIVSNFQNYEIEYQSLSVEDM